MARIYREKTVDIVKKMHMWREFGTATTSRRRNKQQKAFDCGVMACSEFIRRMTEDESLALQCHALLTPCETDSIGLPIKEISIKEGGEA